MLVVDSRARSAPFNEAGHLAIETLEHLLVHGEVRSEIDVLAAAFCIENDYALLHRDRDFDAFEHLRGLRAWRQ